jgi:hypothetical protein
MKSENEQFTLSRCIYDHITTTLILQQQIPKDVIQNICNFAGGFITEGNLVNTGTHSHQMRYLHNLLFMDFWHMEKFIAADEMFGRNWEMSYLTCIYNPRSGALYTDCFNFYKWGGHPYPIYNLKKIAREYYQCTDINHANINKLLNTNPRELYDKLKCIYNNNLSKPVLINNLFCKNKFI